MSRSVPFDESVADHRELPSQQAALCCPSSTPGQPRLVLYLDNLESLMSRPSKGSYGTAERWCHADVAELWRHLVQTVREADGQLVLLASCRVTHPDLQPYRISLRPLAPDATWYLLGRLPAMQHLDPENRHRLLKRIDGYPQLAMLLDALLHRQPTSRTQGQGHAESPLTVREEWRQHIAPVLPTQNQPLSEPLLFKAIWYHRLDDPARCLLARATVGTGNLSPDAGSPRGEDAETAHRLLDHP